MTNPKSGKIQWSVAENTARVNMSRHLNKFGVGAGHRFARFIVNFCSDQHVFALK